MHIAKFFGAIKKKLSPRGGNERRCHSNSNTPRNRNSTSSSNSSFYSAGDDEYKFDETIFGEEVNQISREFMWDEEKIRANISQKQNNSSSANINNSSKSSSKSIFSKYKRSSSVSSCLDQLASNKKETNSNEKSSSGKSKNSPRFDFFSKKRNSASDLDYAKSRSSNSLKSTNDNCTNVCSNDKADDSRQSSSSTGDYSEFNLRIPSSRTLNRLLNAEPVINNSKEDSNNCKKETNRKGSGSEHSKFNSKPIDNSDNKGADPNMLEPNSENFHQPSSSSSSFDAFFEEYSNSTLDSSSTITNSSLNTIASKPLASSTSDELCSMKSFRRTPSAAKNNKQENKSSTETKPNNNFRHEVSSSISSSTSLDLVNEETMMKFGMVRISLAPLTSNTTSQKSTEELLKEIKQN